VRRLACPRSSALFAPVGRSSSCPNPFPYLGRVGCETLGCSCCATESEFVMGCPRCHNLMMEEMFVDWETSPRVSSFRGWRCVICGEILDPIILQNRTLHPVPQYGRARTKVA
jgi:hypothetical protein